MTWLTGRVLYRESGLGNDDHVTSMDKGIHEALGEKAKEQCPYHNFMKLEFYSGYTQRLYLIEMHGYLWDLDLDPWHWDQEQI